MNNNIVQYAKQERVIRKKYRDVLQTALFWLLAASSFFYCIILGLSGEEGAEDRIPMHLLLIFVLLAAVAFRALNASLLYITENNQGQNIFIKYLFVPRKTEEIFLAKALVLVEDAAVMTLIGQSVTLLTALVLHGGKWIVYWETFAPAYTGGIILAEELLAMWILYREAKRNG